MLYNHRNNAMLTLLFSGFRNLITVTLSLMKPKSTSEESAALNRPLAVEMTGSLRHRFLEGFVVMTHLQRRFNTEV